MSLPSATPPSSITVPPARAVAISVVSDTRASTCTFVAGQFAYVQHRIDGGAQHLVTIVVDPKIAKGRDIATYANSLDADPQRWTLRRAKPSDAKLLRRLGVVDVRAQHPTDVAILNGAGEVEEVVNAGAGDPEMIEAALDRVAFGHRRGLDTTVLAVMWSSIVVFFIATIVLGLLVRPPMRREAPHA